MDVVTLQNETAYNAATLTGTAYPTGSQNTALVWFTLGGSYDGTATFETSPDGGTSWFGIQAEALSAIGTYVSSLAPPTATPLYRIRVPAYTLLRVRMSGGTQGTLTVKALLTYGL
jgi:hypothetical protein